jgi:hypothetical protein
MTLISPNRRVIAHCDIDAAYARKSFSGVVHRPKRMIPPFPLDRVRDGSTRHTGRSTCTSLPILAFGNASLNVLQVGVRQWQGLIAINYPARKFGITRHMTVCQENPRRSVLGLTGCTLKADEAKKKCPELQMVHVATCKLWLKNTEKRVPGLSFWMLADREGDVEPGRWDDADPKTHKVSRQSESRYKRRDSYFVYYRSLWTHIDGKVPKLSLFSRAWLRKAKSVRHSSLRYRQG